MIIQRHCYDLRERWQAVVGVVVANVSEHALGRYYERSTTKPSVDAGSLLTLVCGRLGMIAATVRQLGHSELNLAVDGLMVTGSMKIARPLNAGSFATAFFDVRTVLPMSAVDAEQMEQARIIADAFDGDADTASIPVIERRPDLSWPRSKLPASQSIERRGRHNAHPSQDGHTETRSSPPARLCGMGANA